MTLNHFWILSKAAASSWVNDYAQSMGAALAYYTMFSVAPLLLIVISIAGLVFGVEAARGEIAHFTGKDGAFELPQHPDLTLDTETTTIEDAAFELLEAIRLKIAVKRP